MTLYAGDGSSTVCPGRKIQVEEVIMEGEREMKGENTMNREVEDRN